MTQLNDLSLARTMAEDAHQHQTDKLGRPYIDHVQDVAQRVAHLGPDVEIVAWLHDIVEDTDITLNEIKRCFGEDIYQSVDAMTHRKNEDYFQEYLPRLLKNQNARHVKQADIAHNMAKLDALALKDAKTAQRLGEKYSTALRIVNEHEA